MISKTHTMMVSSTHTRIKFFYKNYEIFVLCDNLNRTYLKIYTGKNFENDVTSNFFSADVDSYNPVLKLICNVKSKIDNKDT